MLVLALLSFKFSQNIPANLADEATTAKNLAGITSKETQLSALSIVDDPKEEINRMEKEQSDSIKNSLEATGNLTDQQKAGVDGGKEE